ncbi:MAG: energy-coupling factor transporter ATPase [Acidaminococcaceae bacterium]|nr:energy-coupling factor transporter ATPase [Acidaminococcaceae bacterium]
MLLIENLSYRYKSRSIATLHNVSLKLGKGEMLLLAGKSGCGKSTLLKAVSGLLRATSEGELTGSVKVDGIDIARLTPEEVGSIVGSVYQSPDDQLFAMTVEDEVAFALENRGVPSDLIRKAVDDALVKVGLTGFAKRGIHQLSGGQRQRLALASVIVTRPPLLILDEPVSQMNPQGVVEFMEILTKLNQSEKITIVIVEHRVNELAKYFSRICVINEGQVIFDGMVKDVWNRLNKRSLEGLREPQNIKLSRRLSLTRLEDENRLLAQRIRMECTIREAAEVIKHKKHHDSLLASLNNVFFRYPGTRDFCLKNISFNIFMGQVVAIMGYNGAGKSTLLNLLSGLSEKDSGEIRFLSSPIKEKAYLIGYLRQDPDLMLLADSVWEEVHWGGRMENDEYVNEVIDKLALRNNVDDFPLALSKGQRLRTVLGALLAKKPKLLLLDEPTAGQDQQSLNEIKRLIRLFAGEGGSVVFCTHDIELAADMADRVILLDKGVVVADDEARAVLSNRTSVKGVGLNEPPMLRISEELGLQPCITVKEVALYVDASALGRG